VKIVGWHVDGFGTLRDYDVDGLGDGVTLISGENEAGKSTLLGFLRAMLFGFPKKSTRARQYPPLRGGGHGGQIIVSDNDGRTWTIARNADRKDGLSVTGAGGVTADEAQLRHLLGGADEKLFNSVFAFDLGELTGFDSLDAGGIRERIFSAGITGAGRSARRVIDELDKGADGLLKQGAGKAQINNLVRALEAVDADLRTARERDERYLPSSSGCASERRCSRRSSSPAPSGTSARACSMNSVRSRARPTRRCRNASPSWSSNSPVNAREKSSSPASRRT
jgi:uncharacterized protein YhaN